jgi:hypothetical protein
LEVPFGIGLAVLRIVVIVGPLIGGKDGAGLWFGGGTPLTSFLTTGGGRVLTAVKPEGPFTAVKPLFTAVKPEDDTGLVWGVGGGIEGMGGGC